METYSRIGLLKCHRNLQSYWATAMLWKLTVVLDYSDAMETYSRINIPQKMKVQGPKPTLRVVRRSD